VPGARPCPKEEAYEAPATCSATCKGREEVEELVARGARQLNAVEYRLTRERCELLRSLKPDGFDFDTPVGGDLALLQLDAYACLQRLKSQQRTYGNGVGIEVDSAKAETAWNMAAESGQLKRILDSLEQQLDQFTDVEAQRDGRAWLVGELLGEQRTGAFGGSFWGVSEKVRASPRAATRD